MQLDSALKNTAVLGASGKMGRGISALLLQEIAKENAKNFGEDHCSLILIDPNTSSFSSLKRYLREQTLKYAEKNINTLREIYSDQKKLVSNKEMIDQFVQGAMEALVITDALAAASQSSLVFEAIIEDSQEKAKILSSLKSLQIKPGFFFTNTSSIPIHVLEDLSGLHGHLIGFHFYNPPLVQKLVELVIPKDCKEELKALSKELLKRFNKIEVIAEDVAGFIGNGYLMQETVFACEKAREFGTIHSMAEGIYLVDTVTKEWLLRPMGIFQLIDYVGIDVTDRILKTMQVYLPHKKLHDELIDWMILSGKTGGQTADGTLKPGFFAYEQDKIVSVYDPQKKIYIPIEELREAKAKLGKEPSLTFKTLQNDPEKLKKIVEHFKNLKKGTGFGDELGQKILVHLQKISEELVHSHVAKKREDVDLVLKNGFYHLYGAFESEAF
ncbi:MAG TPA: 3-hydroxyacyl-CoA dehydrogenase family protein [Parachlamydiaceae bacterium]|nr:3-hydroxyacyl-CoA dehydrogenase family protein [Parachlamydiaceae bacterium]